VRSLTVLVAENRIATFTNCPMFTNIVNIKVCVNNAGHRGGVGFLAITARR